MVIQQAKKQNVVVHTIIRLGRDTSEAIIKTVQENATDLILLGWPGYTHSAGKIFGSVIDPILKNPPADISLVRYRSQLPLRSILVLVAGELNSCRAAKMAINMAKPEEGKKVLVFLLNVILPNKGLVQIARAKQAFRESVEELQYDYLETRIIEVETIEDVIIREANSGNRSNTN